MQLAVLAKDCLSSCMQELGWSEVEHRFGMYFKQKSAEIEFYFSMNAPDDSESGPLFLLPVVGVTHCETSRLEERFLGLPPTPGPLVGTVGRGLLDLWWREGRTLDDRWVIRSRDDVEQVIGRVVEDFELYGLPFLQSLGTLEDIIRYLKRIPRGQEMSGKLAIACALHGLYDDAAAAFEEYAAEARDQVPPMSTQSWGFIRSYGEYFRDLPIAIPQP